ncbi:hypothetical protein LI014_10105 [Clostridium perfringens]|uniref:hypothetical protein n=1 Tax=Clostridium perfringens TaxID=1502 RepID=UPI0022486ECD|nr:hypothetical protein [Clostridium perfringens]MCX0397736.1 hypothetical protein [Clostridium perfringens]
MNDKIEVSLISGAVSLLVSLSSIVTQRYLATRKGKNEEFRSLINEHKEIFSDLLKIEKKEDVEYSSLLKRLNNSPTIFIMLPKSIKVLFDELVENLKFDNKNIEEQEEKILCISKKIIKELRKVGVDSSELNK